MLSEEILGHAKEFIEFVVQLIPWSQAGIESRIKGVEDWGYGRVRRTGMEG